jgi:hypothetical protein
LWIQSFKKINILILENCYILYLPKSFLFLLCLLGDNLEWLYLLLTVLLCTFFFQNPILFLKNNSYTARSDEYSSKSLTLVYRNYRWNRAWLPSSSKYDFLVQIPRVTIMEFPWSYGCICACKIQGKITCVLHLLKNDIYTRARAQSNSFKLYLKF